MSLGFAADSLCTCVREQTVLLSSEARSLSGEEAEFFQHLPPFVTEAAGNIKI